MSFSSDPFWLIFVLILGGVLSILAGGWNLARKPRPRGGALFARLLFSTLSLAVGAGAIWTALYQVSAGDSNFPDSLPNLAEVSLPPEIKTRETTGDLTFHRDVAAAWSLARETGRPLLIDFFAEWCDPCHKWNRQAIDHADLNAALRRAVLARVHDTDPTFDAFQAHPAHAGLRIGLPYFVVIDSSGVIRYQSNDYRDTQGMIKALNLGRR